MVDRDLGERMLCDCGDTSMTFLGDLFCFFAVPLKRSSFEIINSSIATLILPRFHVVGSFKEENLDEEVCSEYNMRSSSSTEPHSYFCLSPQQRRQAAIKQAGS
mmetsp:Transcript_48025/g.96074  ORF Transcript_48025/g.96074 Transcript_48025/m.96074 type:complete len:104 (+) Transcript_48025:400-711(+)